MATYPIKMLRDENGQAFVPLTSLDAVMGEKNLQYILDAEQVSPGHFRVNYKDLKMKDLVNSIIVVRWPEITSTVKPSYLQLNTETEAILYNGTGTEYLDLEEASKTVNMLAYDGEKWILTSGAGSGSGHVITDDEGHTMEQQKILNFVGFNVENDMANRATKIINPTPINNLTTTESGQGSLDAYQGYILSGRTIPTGGSTGQVLAKKNGSDYQVEWVDRDSDDVITSDGSIEEIVGVTYEEYKALEAAGNLKPTTQYHITDMTDGDISFISTDDIQTMIDNSIRTDDEIQTIVEENVVNNLTSTSTTSALSAMMGATLEQKRVPHVVGIVSTTSAIQTNASDTGSVNNGYNSGKYCPHVLREKSGVNNSMSEWYGGIHIPNIEQYSVLIVELNFGGRSIDGNTSQISGGIVLFKGAEGVEDSEYGRGWQNYILGPTFTNYSKSEMTKIINVGNRTGTYVIGSVWSAYQGQIAWNSGFGDAGSTLRVIGFLR